MIKVDGQVLYNNTDHSAKVDLIADTKAEVSDDLSGVEVVGLDTSYDIAMGSTIMAFDTKELAFRKSDGTWAW